MRTARHALLAGAALLALPLVTPPAGAQEAAEQVVRPSGLVLLPQSSVARPEDAGLRAHTHLRVFRPHGQGVAAARPAGNYETPASLACLYRLVPQHYACNPSQVRVVAKGGSRAIAIVDAYDYPTAADDLAYYSRTYGLPAITPANFQVVYATGTKPPQDSSGGWTLEAALDVQMAHALAPDAVIYLVEAASNAYSDLMQAETVAADLVAAAGGGQVSNSWGGSEFSTEASLYSFVRSGVTFFASTGDTPGTEYPSVSPDVIAVGGTTVNRTAAGDFVSETAWSETGGGGSAYLPRPAYQNAVKSVVGGRRGVPDVALDADPASGAYIYTTTPYEGTTGWFVVGGTSLASPAMAAIVNWSGHFAASSAAELATIYHNRANTNDFTDIVAGSCGSGGADLAVAGWDFCTGVGTPYTGRGK